MLPPKSHDSSWLTPAIEAAATRNARLAVRLRRTIVVLHQIAPDHGRFVRWTVCPHPDCRAAAALLVERFTCERCLGEFQLTEGAAGRFCGRCNITLGKKAV